MHHWSELLCVFVCLIILCYDHIISLFNQFFYSANIEIL